MKIFNKFFVKKKHNNEPQLDKNTVLLCFFFSFNNKKTNRKNHSFFINPHLFHLIPAFDSSRKKTEQFMKTTLFDLFLILLRDLLAKHQQML